MMTVHDQGGEPALLRDVTVIGHRQQPPAGLLGPDAGTVGRQGARTAGEPPDEVLVDREAQAGESPRTNAPSST